MKPHQPEGGDLDISLQHEAAGDCSYGNPFDVTSRELLEHVLAGGYPCGNYYRMTLAMQLAGSIFSHV